MLELGDEVDLKLNFQAIIMKETIEQECIRGVREIMFATCSLLISYDPLEIKIRDLIDRLKALEDRGLDFLNRSLPSRLIHVPILFNDRWTIECSKAHGLPPDLESVAEYNGLSIGEFINVYTSTDYWVKYLGFCPGEISFNALDPKKELRAAQLKVPRTWTPQGAIGIYRSGNCIYPAVIPGGVKLVGRTPLLVFDIHQKNPAFRESPALFKPGDRLRITPIDEKEYLAIEKNIDTYLYEMEEGTYSGNWLQSTS
jgi:urea carboxylase